WHAPVAEFRRKVSRRSQRQTSADLPYGRSRQSHAGEAGTSGPERHGRLSRTFRNGDAAGCARRFPEALSSGRSADSTVEIKLRRLRGLLLTTPAAARPPLL